MPQSLKAKAIRILLADDHAIVRAGLRRLLEEEADFAVVGEAGDGEQAVALVKETSPDVLLLDLRMPRVSGLEALRELALMETATRTIVLAAEANDAQIQEVLRCGARGVVLKRAATRELLKSIRCVMRGEYWVDRSTLAGLIRTPAAGQPPQPRLTRRELELVQEVRAGCSNRDIANKFSISEETVKRHLANMFEKLGISSRVELAVYATEHDLASLAK